MGQTLTHGVYLPDEGERNCYAGLAANWQLLDTSVGTVAEHTTQIAGKAPAVHTHTKADVTDFPVYGNTAGTICEGNDSRLSDARTPVAHTHGKADITDLFNSANTWTDTNTFSNYIVSKESAAIPAGSYGKGIVFRDYQSNRLGYIQPHVTSDSEKRLLIGVDAGVVAINSSLIPHVNNSYDLGSSSYQWNDIYANAYYSQSTAAELSVSGGNVPILFKDKNGKKLAGITLGNYASSKLSYNRFSIYDKDSNNQELEESLEFAFVATNQSCYFRPSTSDKVNLGSSSYQWNNLYAKNYYYNGTQWGLNVKNIWTHYNVINGYRFEIKQASQEIGVLPSSNQWNGFNFVDKNEQNTVSFQHAFLPTESRFSISMVDNVASHDSNSTVWIEFLRMTAYSGGSGFIVGAELRPSNNNLNLGNSTNKWKTLNGVNPGALSFPDYSQVENIKNISNMTFNGATGNLIQTASQTSNTFEDSGYLIVKLRSASVGDFITIKCQQNNIVLSADDYPQFKTVCVAAGETIGLVVPIAKRQQPYIFANKQPTTFKFVKCYGNV